MNFFNPFRWCKKQEPSKPEHVHDPLAAAKGMLCGIALGMAFWGALGLIVWMVRL
jgi:hypothetical protein